MKQSEKMPDAKKALDPVAPAIAFRSGRSIKSGDAGGKESCI